MTYTPQQLDTEDTIRKLHGAVLLVGGNWESLRRLPIELFMKALEPNGIKIKFEMVELTQEPYESV